MKTLYVLIYIILFFTCNSILAAQPEQKLLIPVIVEGEQIKQLLGKKIEHIRAYAFRNGKPTLIPFQIDQKDSKGNWVWEKVLNANQHEMKNYDDEDRSRENIFDDNDQIVFMAIDAGEKVEKPSEKIAFSEILELKITAGKSGHSNWIYVTYHSFSVPSKSNTHYMEYQADKKMVKSPVYSLTYSKKYIAVMDEMTVAGQSLINQTIINGKVDVNFILFNSSIEFNEKEINGYSVGYINGPIRTIIQFMTFVNLGAGIQSMALNVDHIFYPNHTEIPILINKGYFVKNMSIRIGANYSYTDSCQIYNPGLEIMTDVNKSRAGISLMSDIHPQLLMLNNSAYSMSTFLKIPTELKEKISTQAYIKNEVSHELKNKPTDNSKLAGFYLRTRENFPSGQHQLKVVSIFSDKPYIYKKANIFNEKIFIVTKKI